jgi:hypothetical protein
MICDGWLDCVGTVLALSGGAVGMFAELRRGLRKPPVPPADLALYKRLYRGSIVAIVVGVALQFDWWVTHVTGWFR